MDRAGLDTVEAGRFAVPAAFDTAIAPELDMAADLASDIALGQEHRDRSAVPEHRDRLEADTADMANIVNKVMMAADPADFPYIAPFVLQIL